MPDEAKFTVATPQNSGMTAQHILDVQGVCQSENTFIFIRPSTTATMRLIAAGFATKSMDVHDKSSDWGLTSGFVPVDQAFSKKQSNPPKQDINPHAHGEAQPVHLKFDSGQFATLSGTAHFEHITEVPLPSALPCAAGDAAATARHYHSPKNDTVCFLYMKASGEVFWRWRTKVPNPPVPMYVWGYNGVPVTGDYDLWMVAPHISNVKDQGTAVDTVKDTHGRSAATAYTTALLGTLNRACKRATVPVFNHGAEAQNASFTQALDHHLVLFCPGSMAPKYIPRTILPGMLHDLLRHNYVVMRNPKWMTGVTLGMEDMAYAEELFPDDPNVKAGVAAFNSLQRAAGRTFLLPKLQQMRAKKENARWIAANKNNPFAALSEPDEPDPVVPDKAWTERYADLRRFRALGNMPDEQDEDLVLPPEAFQPTSAEYYIEAQKDSNPFALLAEDDAEPGAAREFGAAQEATFKRQGFVVDDGHVVPVDSTPKPPLKRR
jgi:Anthrax toxin LF subunit